MCFDTIELALASLSKKGSSFTSLVSDLNKPGLDNCRVLRAVSHCCCVSSSYFSSSFSFSVANSAASTAAAFAAVATVANSAAASSATFF